MDITFYYNQTSDASIYPYSLRATLENCIPIKVDDIIEHRDYMPIDKCGIESKEFKQMCKDIISGFQQVIDTNNNVHVSVIFSFSIRSCIITIYFNDDKRFYDVQITDYEKSKKIK